MDEWVDDEEQVQQCDAMVALMKHHVRLTWKMTVSSAICVMIESVCM